MVEGAALDAPVLKIACGDLRRQGVEELRPSSSLRKSFRKTIGCFRMPKRFRLLLVEHETGHVLNQAGRTHLRGQPSFEPSFDTDENALSAKDALLDLFPWAEVVVTDAETANATTFQPTKKSRELFERLRNEFRHYQHSTIRRWLRPPPPYPWDPSSYHLDDADAP